MKKKLLYLLSAVVLLFSMLPVSVAHAVIDWEMAPRYGDAIGDSSGATDIGAVAYEADETNIYIHIIAAGSVTTTGMVSWTYFDIDSNSGTGDPNAGGDPSVLAGAELWIETIPDMMHVFIYRWNGTDGYDTAGMGSFELVDSGAALEITIPKQYITGDVDAIVDGSYSKQVLVDTSDPQNPGVIDTAEGTLDALSGGEANPGDPDWWPVTPTIPDSSADAVAVPEITGIDYVIEGTDLWLRYIASAPFTFADHRITTTFDIDNDTSTGDTSGMVGPLGAEYAIRTDYTSGTYTGTDIVRYDAPGTPLTYGGWTFTDAANYMGYFYYTIPLAVFGADASELEDGVVKVDAVVAAPGETPESFPMMVDEVIGVTDGSPVTPSGPAAAFSPTSGPVGTMTAVTGYDWSPNEFILSVTVGGTAAAHTLTVDGDGNLMGPLTIPDITDGTKDVVITGSASGIQTYAEAFTVTSSTPSAPEAAFNPTSGPVGTVIAVTGYDWSAGESIVSATVGGVTATHGLAVDGSGNLAGPLEIPDVSEGAQDIVITGATSGAQTYTGAFTVTAAPSDPSAVFDPTSGPAGTVVTVTGSDWPDYETINSVTVGGVSATHSLAGNNIGELNGTITIPEITDGQYDVVIAGQASGLQTFADAFTVTSTPAAPNIIRNGDFESGFDEWQVHPNLPWDWNPVSGGQASIDPPVMDYYGPVYYQNLNVTDVADVTFDFSMDVTNVASYSTGNTVAVYLVYVDTSDVIQKAQIVNPANADITTDTAVSTTFTAPSDARELVKVVVVKEDYGDFTIDNLVLTGDGVTIGNPPIVTGLSAPEGAYGSSLTITGTDFGTTQGEVTIGGSPEGITVTNWSDTSITVTVDEPARNGPVVVTADFVDSNYDFFYEISSPHFTLDIMADHLEIIEGGPAVLIIGLKFFNGFAPDNGITLQLTADDQWMNGVFAPEVHYTAGGAICRIDTTGFGVGVYPITVEAVGDDFVTRTATVALEITETTDITFYQMDASYYQNEVTSVTADYQGDMQLSASGTDSNGRPISEWLTLTSSDPSVVGVYEDVNMDTFVYALTTGSANLIATAPDGYSETLPITVTVPADPAITNISLTPAVTTNLWNDTMTFYGEGTRPIAWFTMGMTSDEITNDTRDYSPDNLVYSGTFELNPETPPGIGNYLFGVRTYEWVEGSLVYTSESVAPLTVVNDDSYSALEVGVVALDEQLDMWQIEHFSVEFYQGGVYQFTREAFMHGGGPEPEVYMGAIPPGTYTLRYIPTDTSVRDQWYPNTTDPAYAQEVTFTAGQTMENIYFFVLGYPEGEEATLEQVEVIPANPVMEVSETRYMDVVAHYSNGFVDEYAGYSAAWDSSDTTVATIDTSGFVEALSAGETTITATVDGVPGSTTLTVNAPAELLVSTQDATDVTEDSAVLNGTLQGLDGASATVSFVWGTESGNYPYETDPQVISTAGQVFTANLTGLTDNTTYYYRAKAVGDTTVFGDEIMFKTLEVPTGEPVPGDANGDGQVNVYDITQIARIILELDGPTPGADVNGDTKVNVLDITAVVNIILQIP